MTPPHRLQYYILPDDPLQAVNMLRAAANLDPLSGENDSVQLDDFSQECSPDAP